MEKDDLKQQMDVLWDKMRERPGTDLDAVSAYDRAEQELRADTLKKLQGRFEKEKLYWQNVIAAKEETIARLEAQLEGEESRVQDFKKKIAGLHEGQSQLLQQSFETLELQKRSMNSRIEQFSADLESARKTILDLQMSLKDEKDLRAAELEAWTEKERQWTEERDRRESELEETKRDLFQKRQSELKEVESLEENIRTLESRIAENKEIFDGEKGDLQKTIRQREETISGLEKSVQDLRQKSDAEKEERRLASIERERQSMQQQEDHRHMVEQLLARETKIKELQDSLERLTEERRVRENTLRKKEEELITEEESLRKRREEWVSSIKDQSTQQLGISSRVVDMLSRLENRMGVRPPSAALQSPLPPPPNLAPPSASRPETAFVPAPVTRPPHAGRIAAFWRENKGLVILAGLFFVLVAGGALYLLGSEGWKSVRAQKYLDKGNSLFSQGRIDDAFLVLQRAYDLDPSNTMARNALTLVLGELAHRNYREGKFEDALKKTEILYKIMPEDPDVVQLHNDILQTLGKKDSAPGK